MPTPLVTIKAPVAVLVLAAEPLISKLPLKLFCEPPEFTLPLIPAPPVIINAPLVLLVDIVLLPM